MLEFDKQVNASIVDPGFIARVRKQRCVLADMKRGLTWPSGSVYSTRSPAHRTRTRPAITSSCSSTRQ
jgi:hypothetical protein